jgi:hypothetical protein
MGPAKPGETLDRKNNDDPRYGPGLCEWKDKQAQALNRHSTWKLGDETLNLVAARSGVSVRTLRRQARSENPFGANPLAFKPWPVEKTDWWERNYKSGPHLREYRFEYLIRRLTAQRNAEERWAHEHEDALHSDDPEVRREAERRGRLLYQLTQTLVRARIDHDRWLPFAERFIRQHPTLAKDGQTRRSPNDDEWE